MINCQGPAVNLESRKAFLSDRRSHLIAKIQVRSTRSGAIYVRIILMIS
ncbi:hypothetical protein QUA82_23935 [Microcoleus sp. F8-D3]